MKKHHNKHLFRMKLFLNGYKVIPTDAMAIT